LITNRNILDFFHLLKRHFLSIFLIWRCSRMCLRLCVRVLLRIRRHAALASAGIGPSLTCMDKDRA
jgi:hypothetical protein